MKLQIGNNIEFVNTYSRFVVPEVVHFTSKTIFCNQNIWAFLFECSGYHYNIWNKINITTELSYMYGRGGGGFGQYIYNHNFVRFANYPQKRINLESEQKNMN